MLRLRPSPTWNPIPASAATPPGIASAEAKTGACTRHFMSSRHRRESPPAIKAYLDKRLAEGRTRCGVRRCIKRYLARHICRTLNTLYGSATDKEHSSSVTFAPTIG
jgi:transposase